MPSLDLITIQFDDKALLEKSLPDLEKITNHTIQVNEKNHDIAQFLDSKRDQYNAVKFISVFENIHLAYKVVVYTSVDLFIPIFTFVFGLAILGGDTAIVSSHRLRNEYYGLPADDDLLRERLVKETIHELGHLLNLRHCNNYKCVMASSNTIDDLDVKGNQYCEECKGRIIT